MIFLIVLKLKILLNIVITVQDNLLQGMNITKGLTVLQIISVRAIDTGEEGALKLNNKVNIYQVEVVKNPKDSRLMILFRIKIK